MCSKRLRSQKCTLLFLLCAFKTLAPLLYYQRYRLDLHQRLAKNAIHRHFHEDLEALIQGQDIISDFSRLIMCERMSIGICRYMFVQKREQNFESKCAKVIQWHQRIFLSRHLSSESNLKFSFQFLNQTDTTVSFGFI